MANTVTRLLRGLGAFAGLCLYLGTSVAQPASAPIRMIPLPAPVAETRLTETTQGEIWFDSRAPFDFDLLLNHLDRVPKISTFAYLFLPHGASAKAPVPAMVVLPGSGGLKLGRQMLHANNLVAAGYAALVVDYYASRNVNDDTVPYAVMVSNVTEFDVVTDAYSALKALNRHPAIDPKRIGVMGFSYGGIATRLAMDSRLKKLLAPDVAPFAAHVDYYGPCFQDIRTRATTGAPLLSLRGAHDASNDLVQCTAREEQLRAAGSEVSSRIYATAGHSWDNLGARVMGNANYLRGCEMLYDDKGFASVKGKQMITARDPLDRDSRYALRMGSDRFFEGCVKNGYFVGRDQPVYEDSNRELLRFLDEKLAQKPLRRSP
jgi:dienelactone hydrolase